MYCITRNDMKFGEYFIPARTKAEVINKPTYKQADLPGLQLRIVINLFDIHPNKGTGVPLSVAQKNNELKNGAFGQMYGIAIYTNAPQVYLDAGDSFYQDSILSEWRVRKIFGETIPESIRKAEFERGYLLIDVVYCLEEEFSDWVQDNCHFRKLTKRDIENGDGFDGASPGDRMLSGKGLEQFHEKRLEYQKRLEVTGFTYDFKGGLIWD